MVKTTLVILSLVMSFNASAQQAALAPARIAAVQSAVQAQNLAAQAPRLAALTPATVAALEANLALQPAIGVTASQLIEGINTVATSDADVVNGLDRSARIAMVDKLLAVALESANNAASMGQNNVDQLNALVYGQAYLSLVGLAPTAQAMNAASLQNYARFIDALQTNVASGLGLEEAANQAAVAVLGEGANVNTIVDACATAGAGR